MSDKYGKSVTAIMRELLILHDLCDYATAEKISKEFDDLIVNCSWIETLNGTTFDRGFDPVLMKRIEESKASDYMADRLSASFNMG